MSERARKLLEQFPNPKFNAIEIQTYANACTEALKESESELTAAQARIAELESQLSQVQSDLSKAWAHNDELVKALLTPARNPKEGE